MKPQVRRALEAQKALEVANVEIAALREALAEIQDLLLNNKMSAMPNLVRSTDVQVILFRLRERLLKP